MKKLKRVKLNQHSGTPDYLNLIACFLMFAYNLIDTIYKHLSIAEYFLYLAPFFLYIILNVFLRSKNITASLYAVIGLLTIIFDPIDSGASGILYMYFSYNEIKSNKLAIILASASYIGLSIRFLILNTMGSEAIISILLFTFIFATLYFKVIKDNSRISKLPEEIKAILKQYCNGYTYEQISFNLGLGVTPGTIRRKITAFMNKHEIKNDAQLGKWLHRNV